MSITYEEARIRNLKIKIVNALINNSQLSLAEKFDNEKLVKLFYFKQRDVKQLKTYLFSEDGRILDEVKRSIEEIIQLNTMVRNEVNYEEECEKLKVGYLSLKNHYDSFKNNQEFIEQQLNNLSTVSRNLHYYILPIYDERFICNSEIIPEDDLRNYYYHFHTIEDLYRCIFEADKSLSWKSTGGDLNLGYKLNFKVYTSRWGHYDNYTFSREYYGWKIGAFGKDEKCDKNGGVLKEEGKQNDNEHTGLYYFLNHDSVQYPRSGVEYALEVLWNDADSKEMGVEELQSKLSDIAAWISGVEKATHQYQPSWCSYY